MSDLIVGALEQSGYFGIFLLMLVENIFPPIPSEVIMPFAGLLAARGELDPVLAVFAGTLGSLVGALPWFALGYYVSGERRTRLIEKYGVYFSISRGDMERAIHFFIRYQRMAVFFGRLIPAIRTVISVPAGSIKMRLESFLVLTALGSALWNIGLLILGYILEEQYTLVGEYVDLVVYGIIGVAASIYIYRITQHLRARRKERLGSADEQR